MADGLPGWLAEATADAAPELTDGQLTVLRRILASGPTAGPTVLPVRREHTRRVAVPDRDAA